MARQVVQNKTNTQDVPGKSHRTPALRLGFGPDYKRKGRAYPDQNRVTIHIHHPAVHRRPYFCIVHHVQIQSGTLKQILILTGQLWNALTVELLWFEYSIQVERLISQSLIMPLIDRKTYPQYPQDKHTSQKQELKRAIDSTHKINKLYVSALGPPRCAIAFLKGGRTWVDTPLVLQRFLSCRQNMPVGRLKFTRCRRGNCSPQGALH